MALIRKLLAAYAVLFFAGFQVTGVALADGNERGRTLFDLCAQCHGSVGEGLELSLAPAIAGLDDWYVTSQLRLFKSGARGTHHEDVGGMRMHPMSRWLQSDEDIAAVTAYVSSLPKVAPTPVVDGGHVGPGKTIYATCAACHGQQGEGNESMNSPPLRYMSDWYLVKTLEKYKSGVRGSNPANTNAVLMRGMSNVLADGQAIKDVVAYISTLK